MKKHLDGIVQGIYAILAKFILNLPQSWLEHAYIRFLVRKLGKLKSENINKKQIVIDHSKTLLVRHEWMCSYTFFSMDKEYQRMTKVIEEARVYTFTFRANGHLKTRIALSCDKYLA